MSYPSWNQYQSRVRHLTKEEAAWVGALVEGEGYIRNRLGVPDAKSRTVVGVGSTEIETIATLLRLVGDGRVSMSRAATRNRKLYWSWELANRPSVYVLLPQLLPYFTGKSNPAHALLDQLQRLYTGRELPSDSNGNGGS